MMTEPRKSASDHKADLRRRAEARAVPEPDPEETEVRKLLHELQVHQIELELQNAELQEAQAETEAGLERYTDLYNFAPVGYFTLERDGTIVQANLAGTAVLGLDRSELVGRRFGIFVDDESRADFAGYLNRVSGYPLRAT